MTIDDVLKLSVPPEAKVVLLAALRAGEGPHNFKPLAEATRLSNGEVQFAFRQLKVAGCNEASDNDTLKLPGEKFRLAMVLMQGDVATATETPAPKKAGKERRV